LAAGGVLAKDPVGTQVLEFETPAGTFHILDKWQFKAYQVGTVTGRIWVAQGVSPFQLNTKLEQGVVQQWVSIAKAVPLDEHAPASFYKDDFKITVNANDELMVLHEEDLTGEGFRCLGTAK
jgi:hypothetical protein